MPVTLASVRYDRNGGAAPGAASETARTANTAAPTGSARDEAPTMTIAAATSHRAPVREAVADWNAPVTGCQARPSDHHRPSGEYVYPDERPLPVSLTILSPSAYAVRR